MNPFLITLAIVAVFNMAAKGVEEVGTMIEGRPVIDRSIEPPCEVPAGVGFDYQHDQNERARTEFFKSHELIRGEWKRREL